MFVCHFIFSIKWRVFFFFPVTMGKILLLCIKVCVCILLSIWWNKHIENTIRCDTNHVYNIHTLTLFFYNAAAAAIPLLSQFCCCQWPIIRFHFHDSKSCVDFKSFCHLCLYIFFYYFMLGFFSSVKMSVCILFCKRKKMFYDKNRICNLSICKRLADELLKI